MHTPQTIIDISLSLSPQTILYPGNPKVEMETVASPGGSQLTKIAFGSHTGTHIDAPKHIGLEKGIGSYELTRFLGPCRVLDATQENISISKAFVESKNIMKDERILFKTNNSIRGFSEFYTDYIFLSSEAAIYLAEKEITLVGIDYLSVKQKGSKDNTPHESFLNKGIPIVEGLNLKEVSEGEYTLVCLPLKFDGLDGSPCRAVLLHK